MLEFNMGVALAAHTVKYQPNITACLFGVILLILVYYYFSGEVKKKNSQSKNTSKNQEHSTQDFPTATQWFPFQVPFLDGLITLLRFGKYIVVSMEEYQKRFGKIYWLPAGNLKVLMVNDVKIVQKLLSSNNPQHLRKPSEIYNKIFISWLRDGLINSKFPVWSGHRKMLNHCFTYNCLQNYLQSVNRHGKELTKSLIDSACQNGQAGYIADTNFINNTMHYHLVKVIADVVMGTTSLTNNNAVEFIHHFRVLKHAVSEKIRNPFFGFPLLPHFHPKFKEEYEAMKYMSTFFNNITNKYRRKMDMESNITPKACHNDGGSHIGEKPYRCIIQEMLCQGSTNKEITDQVATFTIAGHETTHMALQMLMMHLALNPVHQLRCREEVDNLVIDMIGDELNTVENLNKLNFSICNLASLKYLERCIMESARLATIVPIFTRTLETPLRVSEELELASGTILAIPVTMIHKDPKHFPDPEKFDPDRFLPENCKKRHPYSYIPFSAGMRNCIGYKLALMEIKVIMALILNNFEIYSTDKLEDVPLLFDVTIRPERNYKIVLKRRS